MPLNDQYLCFSCREARLASARYVCPRALSYVQRSGKRDWRNLVFLLASFFSASGMAQEFAFLPGLSPFQRSLGHAIDAACVDAANGLSQRCAELNALSSQQQRQAIEQLTPFQFLPQSGMPIKLRMAQIDTHERTTTWQQKPVAYASGADGQSFVAQSRGGGAGDGEFLDEALGFFVQGKFQTGAKAKGRASFDFDTYNLTLGGDYRLTDRWVMGLATGYTRTNTTMIQDSGDMISDALLSAFFGRYSLHSGMYVDWSATYGRFNNDLQRRFAYPGFNGVANSQPDADQYGASISLGKDFSIQQWAFNPYARFEYINLQLDAYREQGGVGLNYEVGTQAYDSFISVSGVQVSHAWSLPWMVLTPTLRVEWEHQFLNDNQLLDLRLADASPGRGHFFLPTGNPDRDYFNLGGEMTATLAEGVATFVRYESRLGQAYLTSHLVELGVRIPF